MAIPRLAALPPMRLHRLAHPLSDRCRNWRSCSPIPRRAFVAKPRWRSNPSAQNPRAPFANSHALGAIGPGSRAAVSALIERLKTDPGPNYVFDSAIYALGNIGPDAKEALPTLEEISHRVRLTAPAHEAILQIEGKPVPMYH